MRIEVPYCENYVLKIFARKLNICRLFCVFVFFNLFKEQPVTSNAFNLYYKKFFSSTKVGILHSK